MAAIKKRYEKLADIPEAMRSMYRQDGTAYVLDLDEGDDDSGGDVHRKLAEFRANNRKLAEELRRAQEEKDALTRKASAVGDRDPDEVARALDLLGKLSGHEEAEMIRNGKIDDVLQRRMKTREAEWQKKLDAEKAKFEADSKEAAKARQMASAMLLDKRLRAAIAAKKVRPRQTAEDDLAMRLHRDWKLETLEGDPVSESYADMESWVDTLVSKAPHLFEDGTGGGTGGGKAPLPGGVLKRSDISDKDYAEVLAKGGKVVM